MNEEDAPVRTDSTTKGPGVIGSFVIPNVFTLIGSVAGVIYFRKKEEAKVKMFN